MSQSPAATRLTSLDALRGYLDPATDGIADNTYFEVDAQQAIGLPETAAAGA